jgi:two-component system LytT family response regulator
MSTKQRAIIIDDEENARLTLSVLLQEYAPMIEVVAQCPNVPEGVIAINKFEPDIVFLDIVMPEYNGFELLSFFKEIHFQIIFVSAHNNYAHRAFEVSATDYLMKPVEIEALKAAVEKASQRIDLETYRQQIQLLKTSFSNEEIDKIAIPVGTKTEFVRLQNIVCFEADRAYTFVYLADGNRYTVSKPMKTFEDILENRPVFYRPHRSFLINIHHIKNYSRGESSIEMDNSKSIPIARDKKADFEAVLRDLKLII